VLDALAPVALLVGLGYGLRATGFLPEAAWAPIDRLVYFVLFPCFLFRELAVADLAGVPVARLASCLVLVQAGMVGVANGLRHRFRLDGPAYTSVLQCVVRTNTYVALALTPAVLPAAGVAVAVAVLVPTANLISVTALARHGAGRRPGIGSLARSVLQNPLILATLLGAGANAAGLPQPALLMDPVAIAGRAALALGLLTVGAGLRPGVLATRPAVTLAATAAELVVKPALAAACALVLGLAGPALLVPVLTCALPTATSSYVLARLLGGDAELMAALVTTTTLVALLTLPVVLGLARALG